ncbi:hypothetical protein ACN6KM_02110 [Enterococcus faecium]
MELVDSQNQFIAKGYLGKQNKGIGWVLSQQNIPFDQSFFEEFFVKSKEKRTFFFQMILLPLFVYSMEKETGSAV